METHKNQNMKSITAILLLGIMGILVVFSCNKKNNQSIDISTLSDEQIIAEVQPLLQTYLNGQYSFLTNQSKSMNWQKLQENPTDDTIAKKISFLKSEELKIDYSYTAYTSNISINNIRKNSDIARLKIIDNFTLTTNTKDSETGSFIVTEGSQEYDVAMKYKNGTWIISNFSSIGEDPWYINIEPTTGNIGEHEVDKVRDETQELSTRYTYNPESAKKYAYKYWSKPNKYYCDFQKGGDCTNFLSQCLLIGGWALNEKWWAIGAGCCDNRFPSCVSQNCFTCSWPVAHSFYKYVIKSGRIETTCYADNKLDIGDILQFDFHSDKTIDHSSIVTKKEGSGKKAKVFVTYRTSAGLTPKKDKPSIEIGGIHYGWKVKLKGSSSWSKLTTTP
jgi:hypothetical protein